MMHVGIHLNAGWCWNSFNNCVDSLEKVNEVRADSVVVNESGLAPSVKDMERKFFPLYGTLMALPTEGNQTLCVNNTD